MRSSHIQLKMGGKPTETAAVSHQGTAAVFYSTGNKGLSGKGMFPIVSQHSMGDRPGFYHFLRERHYFRRGRAKGPSALVIRIEGEKTLTWRKGAAA